MRTSWPGDGDDNRAISEAEGKLESAFVLYIRTNFDCPTAKLPF